MNKIIDEELIYDGKIITVKKETLILPNNKKSIREVVHHSKAVAILPIYEQNIILVKQYRTGSKDYMIEIPAGLLEDNEDPIQCAIRELQEEIGYEPKKLTFLGEYYLSPGFCDETIYLYIGEDLIYNPKNPDEDEFIEIIKYPIKDLQQNFWKIINNQNNKFDAKTMLGVSLYLHYNKKQ